MSICPNCGASQDEGALYCTICGSKMDMTAPMPPASSAGWCTVCGTQLEPGAAFCTMCGNPIAAGSGASGTKYTDTGYAGAGYEDARYGKTAYAGGGYAGGAPFGAGAPAPTCPACGTPLEPDAAFCTTCGNPVAAGAVAGYAGGAPFGAEAPAPTCLACGTPLEPDAAFCTTCGNPVATGAGTSSPKWGRESSAFSAPAAALPPRTSTFGERAEGASTESGASRVRFEGLADKTDGDSPKSPMNEFFSKATNL